MYDFTWYDKDICKSTTNLETKGVLIPYKEESVNFDETENLYIEGDNLEVLKLLQKSYYGKIKMIYIDPPYNTGNDFVYKDNFKDNLQNYLEVTGQVDGGGKRISANQETAGRYHSNWLNMMYPRLFLARNLLTDDGVIFISIDDNEAFNLKLILDDIMGEDKFIGQITTVSNPRGRDYGGIARMHEYIISYKKSSDTQLNLIEDESNQFKMFDEKGGFELRELRNRNVKFNKENRPNLYYPFYIKPDSEDENGLFTISLEKRSDYIELYPLPSQGINVVWRWGKERAKKYINQEIKAKPKRDGGFMIVEKYRESRTMARSVWWDKDTNTEKGTLLVKELLDGKVFDYPKPVEMIMRLCEMGMDFESEDIILDFFSGSATTAHAVMQLNAEDGGNRKHIMVQLPEPTDEKSEAFKAGYKNICEIGKERIRRAGNKILEELKLGEETKNLNLDIGFKVLKLQNNTATQ